MEKIICERCGCELEEDEAYFVEDDILCEECLEQNTVTCDHCGERLYVSDAVLDDDTTLCQRCFDDYYYRCESYSNTISSQSDITFSWTSSGLDISGYNLYVAPLIEGTVYYDFENARNYIPGNTSLSYTYKSGKLSPGSYAAYVEAWNIDDDIKSEQSNYVYFVISDDSLIKGDINSDGSVTITDAVLLQKYLLNAYTFTKEQWELADMTGDGKVNVFDLCVMKNKLINS
jgi:hypothetical protein